MGINHNRLNFILLFMGNDYTACGAGHMSKS